MSDYINPDKARTWLDGDAFRAPLGTPLPADIFSPTLASWTAFGGIKAGFTVTPSREITDVPVWNNRTGGAYKRIKQPPTATIQFRAVEYSVATVLTVLRGGSVNAAAGGYELVEGDEEEFATILRVYDGDEQKAYFVARTELLTLPPEVMGATDDVEGFDFELGPLAPADGTPAIRRILSSNPLV